MESQLKPTTPLRICSYPRSGTHLLCALIWANYEVGEAGKKVETDNLRFFMDGRLNTAPFVRWGQLFGTHKHTVDLANNSISPENVVYIIRDPRDVFRSFWFMRFANILPENFVTRKRIFGWKNHVTEYAAIGCPFIKYEDLVVDFESVLAPIVQQFGLKPKGQAAKLAAGAADGDNAYFGPNEIGRIGWQGPAGPTAAAPFFPKHVDARFAECLGDEFYGYKLKGLSLAK